MLPVSPDLNRFPDRIIRVGGDPHLAAGEGDVVCLACGGVIALQLA